MDGTPLVEDTAVEQEQEARPTRVLGPDELPRDVLADVPPKATPPAAPKSAPAAGPQAAAPKPQKPEAPAKTAGGAAAPAAGEDRPPAPPPDRPGTFSETKWFMIGEHIKDEEVEPSDVPVEDLQEIYKRTGALPEEVRRKYSLRYGKDEEASAPKGSGKKK